MPDPRPNRKNENLMRGGAPNPKGISGYTDGRDQKAVQKMALKLVNDPQYRKTLLKKLRDCTLHPSVHVALLYYAWGKPREIVEVQQVVPVRIQHNYADISPLLDVRASSPPEQDPPLQRQTKTRLPKSLPALSQGSRSTSVQ